MISATVRPLAGSALRKQIQPQISIRSRVHSPLDGAAPAASSSPVLSQSSCLATIAYRADKYKRTIRRRVIKASHRSDKDLQSSGKNRRKRGGSFLTHLTFPKNLPKILVGPNVLPQFIPPPPNPICIQASTAAVTGATSPASTGAAPSSAGVASASTAGAASSGSTLATAAQSLSTLATITSATATSSAVQQQSMVKIRTSKKFIQWLNSNIDVLILNVGSLATLTAFLRTDILELRLLSIMGSTGTVVYFMSKPPSQRVYLPVLWSSIFVLTNSYMVYQILEERNGKLTKPWDDLEDHLYMEHFLPYGVTPKQYERLLSKARRRNLKKGTVLIASGDVLDSVYLVARGGTEARTTLSKRITAAGSSPEKALIMAGGDSGAWIGEMAFLDRLSNGGFDGKGAGAEVEEELSKRTAAVVTALSPIAKSFHSSLGGVTSMEGVGESSERRSLKDAGGDTARRTRFPTQSQPQNKELEPSLTTSPQLQRASSVTHKPKATIQHSILTYTAAEDSIILEWTYADLSELLTSSSEFRASVTRAMTAALMGKVVNLYSSSVAHDTKDLKANSAGWW